MIKAFYDAFFPWSFDIISSIKVCFSGIIRHKANIIHPFMVSERCSPHAFSIAVFLPDKSLFLCAVQSFIHIAQMFPVNEIIRPQDFTPRHKVHCGAYHVIRIVYPDDIRIRIVQSCNWIFSYYLHIVSPRMIFQGHTIAI